LREVVQQHPLTIGRGLWVPAFAGTTVREHTLAFSRRDAPELCMNHSP
jgi:hypothetical protein